VRGAGSSGSAPARVQPGSSEDAPAPVQPTLVFFFSPSSGRCRRVEGFLAQVLQRRKNHATFRLFRVDVEERPELVERFAVTATPTLAVLDRGRISATLQQPTGCRDIETFLAPWLR
jgi:thioredoxin-like negative regulator of GroEL